MRKTKKNQNSQRGAALVEAALTIALVGVVCIQAVGQLGDRTADKMCDNAAKVSTSELPWTSAKYYFDKNENACCTATGGLKFANGGPPSCLSTE